MLPQAKVDEIRLLLAKGTVSQRQIARELGISRGTVGAIAAGKRPNYSIKIPDEGIDRMVMPTRCRGCGGLVRAPCRLCRIRALIARERALSEARLKYALSAAG
ncbi:MAG TPA: helix-turn-helix domain-containing protein [Pirellulales bacterium]|nr:helix-turn-helix domain-containing protein [Pirellulales bacterium]